MKPLLLRVLRGLKTANYWLTAQVVILLMRMLRLLPPDRALNIADSFARRVGPWFGRHRVALDNLRQAFPEKSETEIEAIAREMWGNMARLAVEYVFLDTLFDYDDEAPKPGRIEVGGAEYFRRTGAEDKAHIMFTGHLGNFELLAIAGTVYGLNAAIMFRPPNNPYIAKYLLSARSGSIGGLLASRKGAAFALARILEARGNIGVLVDQKFTHGIRTTFFGRPCETSPLVPRLARAYDCDLYPARCVRLPGNRYRLEMEDKLVLPRAADGRVDVPATAQMLNDVVERWVREHPGQWMWFHKRWVLSKPKQAV